MTTEGMFCFEEEHIGCVCGWCNITEEEMKESLKEPRYPIEECPTDEDGRFVCPSVCWGCE